MVSDRPGRRIDHARALIRHVHGHAVAGSHQPDGRASTARVAMHVGQALLHDPEQGGFDVQSRASEVSSDLEIDANPAPLRKPLHVPTQGRGETDLIEQGRM
jgi:hypothetical protein